MNDLFKRVMNEPETIPTIFIIVNDGCPMKHWKPLKIDGLPNFVAKENIPAIGNLDMYLDDTITDIEEKFKMAIDKAKDNHKIVFVPMYKQFKPLLKLLAMNHHPVVYWNNLYRDAGNGFTPLQQKYVEEYNADYELYSKLMGSADDKARMNSLIPQDIEFISIAFEQFVYMNNVSVPSVYDINIPIDEFIEHFIRMTDSDISIVYNVINEAMNNSFYIDMRVFDN